jgi:hypothetical protein
MTAVIRNLSVRRLRNFAGTANGSNARGADFEHFCKLSRSARNFHWPKNRMRRRGAAKQTFDLWKD